MATRYFWMRVETELQSTQKMFRLTAACAVLILVAHSARADGLGDAKAGLEALNRGDNTAAISLFTKAITGGKLSRADKELAYVKRAEAYLAMGAKDKALADAKRALALDASDSEAASVRDKAQGAANTGPSLKVTMQFIQDKLNEQGRFDSSSHRHWLRTNREDDIGGLSDEQSNFVADPASCRIAFHELNPKNLRDAGRDYGFSLRDVRDMVIKPMAQIQQDMIALTLREQAEVTLTPAVFALEVRVQKLGSNDFYFHDEDVANRVAKALLHAVELCGGGNKDPF